jgi:hypothetical protein
MLSLKGPIKVVCKQVMFGRNLLQALGQLRAAALLPFRSYVCPGQEAVFSWTASDTSCDSQHKILCSWSWWQRQYQQTLKTPRISWELLTGFHQTSLLWIFCFCPNSIRHLVRAAGESHKVLQCGMLLSMQLAIADNVIASRMWLKLYICSR